MSQKAIRSDCIAYGDLCDKYGMFPLILSGGQSSRLFPLNKVVCDLFGTGQSLIQEVYDRAAALGAKENIHFLTVPEMVPAIRKQVVLPPNHFYCDPVRRGTWPALLWAMAHLRSKAKGTEAVLAVLTGDHVIPDRKAFLRIAERAIALATQKPAIVMLGVRPTKVASVWQGFGCFRIQKDGSIIGYEEKPSFDNAKKMISAGGWLWNSGMFFFRISTAEEALKRYQPEQFWIYQKLIERLAAGDEAGAQKIFAEFPAKIPHPRDSSRQVDNTIDFAIMSPLVPDSKPALMALAVATPLRKWHDIGQWTALKDVCKCDRKGNILIGRAVPSPEVRECIVAADRGCHIEVRGVQGFVVSCNRDRALVLPVKDLDRIKTLVAESRDPVVQFGTEGLSVSFQAGHLVVQPNAKPKKRRRT